MTDFLIRGTTTPLDGLADALSRLGGRDPWTSVVELGRFGIRPALDWNWYHERYWKSRKSDDVRPFPVRRSDVENAVRRFVGWRKEDHLAAALVLDAARSAIVVRTETDTDAEQYAARMVDWEVAARGPGRRLQPEDLDEIWGRFFYERLRVRDDEEDERAYSRDLLSFAAKIHREIGNKRARRIR